VSERPSAGRTAALPSPLPPLHAAWLDGLLPGPIPFEKRASCDSCAMLPPSTAGVPQGDLFFSPVTKCCTYLPDLANFLVGRVLADDDPDAASGRATVEARLDAGVGVDPFGMRQTRLYTNLYQNSPTAFGRAGSMRCPHYLADEGGRCGVWRHRESTCSTWFCKHERGDVGRVFWRRMHELLRAAENAVAINCIMQVDLGDETMRALFPPDARAGAQRGGFSAADLDETVDRAEYAALWGPWLGREREFYRRCAELVPHDWAEVLRLGGAELALRGRLAVDAYAALRSTEIPARLGGRRLKVVYTSADSVQIESYSGFDPLTVPRRLVDTLHCFDGRPTEDAVAAVATEHGLRLLPGVVRKLVDFAVLIPVDEPPAPT
jgi:hypothetical protein